MRWAIRNDGGFWKTASVRPGGLIPTIKLFSLTPRGVHGGGVNENFSPAVSVESLQLAPMKQSICKAY